MAKKNATDHKQNKQKGKPAAKSPEKAKREATPAKSPKPPKKKRDKEQQPLNREQRKKAAWLRKTERKVAQQAITEVGDKASAGLTYNQLENPNLAARQPKSTGPTFEQTLLEVMAEQARQLESTEPASLLAAPDPEIRIFVDGQTYSPADYEATEGSFGSAATRKVVATEIQKLLKETEAIFDGYHGFGSLLAAQLAAEELFEKESEESPLRFRLAEVVLADNPAAVEDFLEEVWNQVVELQFIVSALEPEGELEKSARLGLIDEATVARLKRAVAEETIRLDLSQRLAGLTVSADAPAEIDETFAALIAEAAQAAEVAQRARASFRKSLRWQLRRRKEREGQRFSKSSEESGDEEFIRFLLSHRGDFTAVRDSLPFRLREQVFQLLEEDKRKGPLRREIAAATEAANRLWAGLKTRLTAGANYPESVVVRNAAAMKNLLGDLAQIRVLHVQLEELDRPR